MLNNYYGKYRVSDLRVPTHKDTGNLLGVVVTVCRGRASLEKKNRLLLDAIATNLKDQNVTTNIDSVKRQIQVRGRELC